MKFSELDVVKTNLDFPEYEIERGEIGTVVVVFKHPKEAYEVEFVNDDGTTKAMFAIFSEDLEEYN